MDNVSLQICRGQVLVSFARSERIGDSDVWEWGGGVPTPAGSPTPNAQPSAGCGLSEELNTCVVRFGDFFDRTTQYFVTIFL